MTIPHLSMTKAAYGIHRSTSLPYERVVERVRAELEKEGFGVLTEIDVQATLKKKLGAEFPRYVILGACAPEVARQALLAQPDVGLLLPCNVVVQEAGDERQLSAVRPSVLFDRLVQDRSLAPLAEEIEERLTRALDRSVS